MRTVFITAAVMMIAVSLYSAPNNINDLEAKAAAGDRDAQYDLGFEYLSGGEVKQDYQSAFKWIKLSAEQRFSEACYTLATMYSEGKGVKADEAESLKWFIIAGEEGHIEARRSLGYMFKDGYGGAKKNLKEAARWFEMIADSYGNKTVMVDLADTYLELKDFTKAAATHKKALEGNEPSIRSAVELADIYYTGLAGKPDYEESYYYWSICTKANIPLKRKLTFSGKIKKDKAESIEKRADDFVIRYKQNMGKGG